MGMRINKVLGWGLYDIETKNDEIIDPRINKNGFLFSDPEGEKWSIEGFESFWETYHTNLFYYELFKMEPKENIILNETVNYDTEYGLPEVLLVTPMSQILHSGWHRKDNIIDYQEEAYNHNCEARYQIFRNGIFPWCDIYCDSNGVRWSSHNQVKSRVANEFIRMKFLKRNDSNLLYLANLLGFDTIEEADKNIIPQIPEEVRMLCKYLKLFNDEKTIYQLRPMLYVFWV